MTKLFYNFNLVQKDFLNFEKNQAMIVKDGLIQWVGSIAHCPKSKFDETIDLKNKNVLPSFVECHTHTVFAGSRANEFEQRLQGASYLEIAEKGGGILSTMRETRAATESALLKLSQMRIKNFIRQGVSVLEIKSGYGLNLESEIKMLKVIQKLQTIHAGTTGLNIVSTFLGAHAKPPEFQTYSDYLKYLTQSVLPMIKKQKLTRRVDIFIENGFFEVSESELFLKEAQRLGFDLTVHANQLTLSGAADLALKLKAQSADHVIHLNSSTIKKFGLSNANANRSRSKTKTKSTVAVLLPTADLYMKCVYPKGRQLIDSGATVALATDFNPGSCPSMDLSLVGLLARLEMKMTLSEVFRAYTINAAKALGMDKTEGSIDVKKNANFICTYADISDFFYSPGNMPDHQLFIRGNLVKI